MNLNVGHYGNYFVESYDGELTIISYAGDKSHITLYRLFADYPLARINKYAFTKEEAPNLIEVRVPITTRIEDGAFHEGVKVERYFNVDMGGFSFEGIHITNPYLDSTGRFNVDPLEYYGLTVEY